MFFKRAKAQVSSVLPLAGFRKRCASIRREGRNLLDTNVFATISKVYQLSPNPNDYLYVVARAVTADVPNANGDAFPYEELTRFHTGRKCPVYRTFANDPLHVNHQADNPEAALGFIIDARLNEDDSRDRYVETVVAVDTTKDPTFARDISSGKLDSFSMGADCQFTLCSFCGHLATSEEDFCSHVRLWKGAQIQGTSVYEKCYGVEFVELSSVLDPADRTAKTQTVLTPQPRKALSVLSSKLDLDDIAAFASYVAENINIVPSGVVKIACALVEEH